MVKKLYFLKLKKPDLTEKEKIQVKKVAKDLLAALKAEKLVLDWRKKQQAVAAVKPETKCDACTVKKIPISVSLGRE